MTIWRNWSQGVVAHPQQVLAPQSEQELLDIVARAGRNDSVIRLTGSGHSFVPLCASDGVIVSLDNLQGIVSIDQEAQEATVWAGTKLHQLGEPLLAAGLGMENMGDIDRQSIAGAISTGTHGTGRKLGSISTQVMGLRLITAVNPPLNISATTNPALLKAAQVSLGALGIISQVTLRLLPAYRLHERTWAEPFETCMAKLDEYIAATRHFEYFWSPKEDACACKSLALTNAPEVPATTQPPASGRLRRYLSEERIDYSHRIFPSERNLLFNEMEFAVPEENGPDCVRAIRHLMQTKHPEVLWPIEYRTLGADDIWLSPAYGHDTVTISIHQAADLPYDPFFRDAEAIFRAFNGRPHWGKIHYHSSDELRQLYPMCDDFLRVRRELDENGRFLNTYLRNLFAIDK
ncbi:MAG: D-arabinono-1,4-lactone oxidase [Chloroflexota bacterium]